MYPMIGVFKIRKIEGAYQLRLGWKYVVLEPLWVETKYEKVEKRGGKALKNQLKKMRTIAESISSFTLVFDVIQENWFSIVCCITEVTDNNGSIECSAAS